VRPPSRRLCRSLAPLPFASVRRPRLHALLACLLAASLALPAAAAANDFQDVYREYKRTGTIKPCRFSNQQLRNAERQTPPDVEQYAPSFLDALQTARERSADCGRKQAAPAPAPTPTPSAPASAPPTASTPSPAPRPTATTPTPAATAPPPAPTVPAQASVTGVPSPPTSAKRHDSAPAAVWLLAALGALIAISALFAGLAWWFGWSLDRYTRPWRASWADFGARAADFGGEFADWLRTGH
jgi:hypothetical protein